MRQDRSLSLSALSHFLVCVAFFILGLSKQTPRAIISTARALLLGLFIPVASHRPKLLATGSFSPGFALTKPCQVDLTQNNINTTY